MSTLSAHAKEDRLDLIFGALSDRTRRALLARLGQAPAKITDLAAPFEMSLPAVSKHVRMLERAGLVRRTIDGRVHRCALEAGPLEEADRWLAHYRVFWEDTLESLARYVAEDRDDPAEPRARTVRGSR
ncbi:MAG TPA: metalloregulator ArsR/SmtB family transcription factor [Kofleriaceae bacterium]|nr:metalloregulator ArsR/SmtB family transcription factor [Kofleriaceae bacterium]